MVDGSDHCGGGLVWPKRLDTDWDGNGLGGVSGLTSPCLGSGRTQRSQLFRNQPDDEAVQALHAVVLSVHVMGRDPFLATTRNKDEAPLSEQRQLAEDELAGIIRPHSRDADDLNPFLDAPLGGEKVVVLLMVIEVGGSVGRFAVASMWAACVARWSVRSAGSAPPVVKTYQLASLNWRITGAASGVTRLRERMRAGRFWRAGISARACA